MEIEIAFLIMDKVVEEHCVTVGREAWRIIRKEYCGSGQNSAAGKKGKISLPDGEHNKLQEEIFRLLRKYDNANLNIQRKDALGELLVDLRKASTLQ